MPDLDLNRVSARVLQLGADESRLERSQFHSSALRPRLTYRQSSQLRTSSSAALSPQSIEMNTT